MPRRVPLRGMRSETKGSAPRRAAARRRAVGEHQAPPAAGVPVEGAGVPVVVDVVVEGAAGTGVPAGVPVKGGAGTGVPGGVTAEPAAEEPVEGAAGTGVPVGVPVEGGAGTGVPEGVVPAGVPVEGVAGTGVPEGVAGTGVPGGVGVAGTGGVEVPPGAAGEGFFLSRCTKLTAWSFTERARRMRDEGWNTTCTRLICPTPTSVASVTPAAQRRVGRKEPRSPSRTLRPWRRLSMISTSRASTTAFTSAEARVHFFSMRSMMCMWSSATGVTSWG